nr:glycoprotein [Ingleside virus]
MYSVVVLFVLVGGDYAYPAQYSRYLPYCSAIPPSSQTILFKRFCVSQGRVVSPSLLKHFTTTERSILTEARVIPSGSSYDRTLAFNCSFYARASFPLPVLDLHDTCTVILSTAVPCSSACAGREYMRFQLPGHPLLVLCAVRTGDRMVSFVHNEYPLLSSPAPPFVYYCDYSTGKLFIAPHDLLSYAHASMGVASATEQAGFMRVAFFLRTHYLFERYFTYVVRTNDPHFHRCEASPSGYSGPVYVQRDSRGCSRPLPGDLEYPSYLCPFEINTNCLVRDPLPTTPVESSFAIPALPATVVMPTVTVGTSADPGPPLDRVVTVHLDHVSTLQLLEEAINYFSFSVTGNSSLLGIARPRAKRFLGGLLSGIFRPLLQPLADAIGAVLKALLEPVMKAVVEVVRPIFNLLIDLLLDFMPLFERLVTTLLAQLEKLVEIVLKLLGFLLAALCHCLVVLDQRFLLFELVVLSALLYYVLRDLVLLSFLMALLLLLVPLDRPYPSLVPHLLFFRNNYVNLTALSHYFLSETLVTANDTHITLSTASRSISFRLYAYSQYFDDLMRNNTPRPDL